MDRSQFSFLQMSFELPFPAVAGMDSQPLSASSKSFSASLYHRTSPQSPAIPASEVVKIRRRSSIAQAPPADAFALPPPPTRSRKFIQMKPRGQPDEAMEPFTDSSKIVAGKPTPAPKKKQPSSTSVAGRKIARKTAHSLIERRRRSKMNENFGVLQDMIPACTGEMHKLAILQATIDYVRYLEDCIPKLKAENHRSNATPTSEQFALSPSASRGLYSSPRQYHTYDDEDVEIGSPENPSPTYSTPVLNSHQPPASLALHLQDFRNRQDFYSSASTDWRHYSPSVSSTTGQGMSIRDLLNI